MPEAPELLGHQFPDIHRIAFLRAGGLGDLIMSLPAAEALASTYPHAELVLLSGPPQAELLRGRPSPFSAVEVLPPWPGVRPGPPDRAEQAAFVARLRTMRFDLGVQVHGGGRHANPLLLDLDCRHTIGARTPDAAPLERMLPYVYYQHEILRALEVVALAGAAPTTLEPRIRLAEHQPREARVVLHPGATDPRRRWPTERFGEVAAALAHAGHQVVVVGDASEAELTSEVVRAAEHAGAPTNSVQALGGRLCLTELVEMLASSELVIANDSGPRHLAAALGTPTVGLYWFGNVINFGPLTRARHRIQIGWATTCPTCGADCTQVGWTAERCPHDDSLITDIGVAAVLGDAFELIEWSASAGRAA